MPLQSFSKKIYLQVLTSLSFLISDYKDPTDLNKPSNKLSNKLLFELSAKPPKASANNTI